jgi:hypothetical protein
MLLERIKTPEFFVSVGYDLPADVMRLALRNKREFGEFVKQYGEGQITPPIIDRLVRDLMSNFRRGERFEYDVTLAFLCVCLESILNPFASQFLNDLAALRLVEMPLSPRVAKECLRQRAKLTSTLRYEFTLGTPSLGTAQPFIANKAPRPQRVTGRVAA